ncbi:MAG: hypothetical protein M3306_29310 [Actinomycetota bacterium]|nr:hypothetical protein [Actinomycetota bacterium]
MDNVLDDLLAPEVLDDRDAYFRRSTSPTRTITAFSAFINHMFLFRNRPSHRRMREVVRK